MNKQEAIKDLESLKMIGNDARAACYNEGINAGITIIKQLDEPQKPVVPQSIAVLIEKYKEDDVQLTDILVCFKDWLESEEGDYSDEISWVVANPEPFMRAWLIGYEVEKEPLYYVVFDILKEQKFLVKNIKTKLFYLSNNENVIGNYEQVSFTEQEIKAIDERFWPFAVPVEEEAEG
ncbi:MULTISPECIES: DUF1642 domain-containing protein [unclassified Enterococcus]|uniref:DUF1642 domain-containing protein n=1 Tax=unclassified Enterococcus TaxID=2608891 RepID=UPI0028FD3808|nr:MULTISPECIES: DUF1642 domain-containing protein [unclassified Enterococcus]MDU0318981.1 DUF1642 domain-containing protein [Enterococcus sp. 2STP]MDU0334507.1 DUF1642 domain-containing protein [Enterococcus sp. 2CBP]MDU0350240.1 DUF1642 domain-containing protein [Enterococcus sp. 3MOLP]